MNHPDIAQMINHVTSSSIFHLLFIILVAYLGISILIFWFITNNIVLWRRLPYTIPFGLSSPDTQITGYLEKPRRYYVICKNHEHKDWVVMFHSWGNNSARLEERARIFWEQGYSLIFLDARSHGRSQYMLYSAAPLYADDMKELLEKFKVNNPIIYGTSFGGIAAVILATKYPIKALIVESITSDIDRVLPDLMNWYGPLKHLYFWVPKIVYIGMKRWTKLSPKYLLPTIHVPILLIHGEKDQLFKADPHYFTNKKALQNNLKAHTWFVKGKGHANIHTHPEYKERIIKFLKQVKKTD